MAAIITENFRKNGVTRLLTDLASESNRYYVGLGKSNAWPEIDGLSENDAAYNVAVGLGTFGDENQIKDNLTTLIGIDSVNCSPVIPKVIPKSSNRHKAYNPFDPTCFYQSTVSGVVRQPCYIVSNNNVYLCLRESTGTVAPFTFPDSTLTNRLIRLTEDGSIWVYIYTIKPEFPIQENQFVSVPISATFNLGEDLDDIQGFTGDLVYGFTVVNGGSGYTTSPVITYVTESNTSIVLQSTIVDGVITKVFFNPATNILSWPKTKGYVTITGGGGTGAIIYPHIAPAEGFGAMPSRDLNSWYIGLKVTVNESVGDGDVALVPYRQVSIVRNPEYQVGTLDPLVTLNCLKSLSIIAGSGSLTADPGEIITQPISGAVAIADYYDAINEKLYYHQTLETGFVPFVSSTGIAISGVLQAGVVSPNLAEYVDRTGDVLFIENQKKISRAEGQSESITLILQF